MKNKKLFVFLLLFLAFFTQKLKAEEQKPVLSPVEKMCAEAFESPFRFCRTQKHLELISWFEKDA